MGGEMTWTLMVVVVCLLCRLHRAAAQYRCTTATDSLNNGGSCSFDYDWCEWSNERDAYLRWEEEEDGRNTYVRVDMSGVRRDNAATLVSPVFCPTSLSSSLTFRYYIRYSNRCRLSVYVMTGSDTTQVYTTTRGVSSFTTVDTIRLGCSTSRFQILLKGEKISNRNCGRSPRNDIEVDNIVFDNWTQPFLPGDNCVTTTTNIPTTTTPTTPPVTSTTTTGSPSDWPHEGRSTTAQPATTAPTAAVTRRAEPDEAGLSGGAVAGIVIAFIIVIVIIVLVLVYIFFRRRRGGWKNALQAPFRWNRSVSRRTQYMLGAQRTGLAVSNENTTEPGVFLPPPPSYNDNHNNSNTKRGPSQQSRPDHLTPIPSVTSVKGHDSVSGYDPVYQGPDHTYYNSDVSLQTKSPEPPDYVNCVEAKTNVSSEEKYNHISHNAHHLALPEQQGNGGQNYNRLKLRENSGPRDITTSAAAVDYSFAKPLAPSASSHDDTVSSQEASVGANAERSDIENEYRNSGVDSGSAEVRHSQNGGHAEYSLAGNFNHERNTDDIPSANCDNAGSFTQSDTDNYSVAQCNANKDVYSLPRKPETETDVADDVVAGGSADAGNSKQKHRVSANDYVNVRSANGRNDVLSPDDTAERVCKGQGALVGGQCGHLDDVEYYNTLGDGQHGRLHHDQDSVYYNVDSQA